MHQEWMQKMTLNENAKENLRESQVSLFFIRAWREFLPYHYLSVMSAISVQNACRVFFHTNCEPPEENQLFQHLKDSNSTRITVKSGDLSCKWFSLLKFLLCVWVEEGSFKGARRFFDLFCSKFQSDISSKPESLVRPMMDSASVYPLFSDTGQCIICHCDNWARVEAGWMPLAFGQLQDVAPKYCWNR